MRLVRIAASLLLVLGALAIAAAWIVPRQLDWSRYRATVEGLAAAATGQDVRIAGALSVQLLPHPQLTANGITLADATHGATLAARELRLRLALWPLLAGRLQASELVLRRPDMRLDWPLRGLSLGGRPAWLSGLSVRITGGTLHIGKVTVSDIEGGVTPDPLSGAIGIAGSAAFSGWPWEFNLRLGAPGGDGAATLDITLNGTGAAQQSWGRLEGRIAANGDIDGRLQAAGPDLSLLLPAPKLAWRADGRLSAAGGLAVADDLALQLNNSPARGAVALRLAPQPRLDLALVASRLDLDAWLPVLLAGGAARLPTGLDLSAEAATLAGGTLRNLRGGFDLRPDGVTLRDASAVLPGEARLSLAGSVAHAANGPQFTGNGHLALTDLRTTMNWLAAAGLAMPPNLPPDVLRAADFEAQVQADRTSLTLSDMRGSVDAMRFSGGMQLGFPQRPTLALDLAVEHAALDPWLPLTAALPADFARRFPPAHMRLKLAIGSADLHGESLGDVQLQLATGEGGLLVQDLEASLRGARLRTSFAIGANGRVADGKLELVASEAGQIVPLLPPALARFDLWHGPARLDVAASGPQEALALNIAADLADARLEAQPVVNLPAGTAIGRIVLRHPGAPRLLAMFGLPAAGAWIGEGSFAFAGQLTLAPGRIGLDDFELTAAQLRSHGQLVLDLAGPEPGLSGRLAAEALPLPPVAPETGMLPVAGLRGWHASLQVDAAEMFSGVAPVLRQAGFTLALADGRLRVDALHAALAGGTLTGTLELATAAVPVLQGKLRIEGAALDGPLFGTTPDLAKGLADATLDLRLSGFSPAAMLASAEGTLSLTLRDGSLEGFDLAAAAQAVQASAPVDRGAVAAALGGGATPVTLFSLNGTAQAGIIRLADAEFAGPQGRGTLAGTIGLNGPSIDLRFGLRPKLADGSDPELGLRLSGPARAPARVVEYAGLAAWEAARPSPK